MKIQYDPNKTPIENMPIGMQATYTLWTDCEPYEIVGHKGSNTILLREMKAELDPSWKPDWVPGGYAGVVRNNEDQKWILSSDSNASITTLRISKKRAEAIIKYGEFRVNGCRWSFGKACKYRDYNF